MELTAEGQKVENVLGNPAVLGYNTFLNSRKAGWQETMMKMTGLIAFIVLMAGTVFAAPKPAIIAGPEEWTLDVKYENLAQVAVHFKGEKQPRRYWYIIMTLYNKTGHDVDFYPKCDLMTDTFQIVPAGKETPGVVFEKIKKLYQTKYPFLEPLEITSDKVLEGEDNIKDIVIIWPDFDPMAKEVHLFITGLSNETAVVYQPAIKDDSGKPKEFFLRKTLELNYKVGGDPIYRGDTKVTFENKRWIMR